MKSNNVTLKMVKELIKELKGNKRENKAEMRYFLRGLAHVGVIGAYFDNVNDSFDYIIDKLETIVTHSK
jgi:hypothetical protein